MSGGRMGWTNTCPCDARTYFVRCRCELIFCSMKFYDASRTGQRKRPVRDERAGRTTTTFAVINNGPCSSENVAAAVLRTHHFPSSRRYRYFFFGPLNNNCRQENVRSRVPLCVRAPNNELTSMVMTSSHSKEYAEREVKWV